MESEGSLQCSQGPTTGSYPLTNECSPHPRTLFLWDLFQYYPSTCTWVCHYKRNV